MRTVLLLAALAVLSVVCVRHYNAVPVVLVTAQGTVCGCITPTQYTTPTLAACKGVGSEYERIVVKSCSAI